MPPPDPAERRPIGPLMQAAVAFDRFLRLRAQPRTGRLARLQRAFTVLREAVDPGWVAVALVLAFMLGGFTWLLTEVHRLEAKLDAASVRLSEMPSTLEGDLQAQTERL